MRHFPAYDSSRLPGQRSGYGRVLGRVHARLPNVAARAVPARLAAVDSAAWSAAGSLDLGPRARELLSSERRPLCSKTLVRLVNSAIGQGGQLAGCALAASAPGIKGPWRICSGRVSLCFAAVGSARLLTGVPLCECVLGVGVGVMSLDDQAECFPGPEQRSDGQISISTGTTSPG